MYGTNYMGIIAAAIASMVVGYVWYGPLFGKQWIKLMGWTEKSVEDAKKKGMAKQYAGMYVASAITAYVLSQFLASGGATTLETACTIAFWVWLGFIATVMFGSVLFENKPMKLFFLNAAYQLVNIVVMAIVLVTLG